MHKMDTAAIDGQELSEKTAGLSRRRGIDLQALNKFVLKCDGMERSDASRLGWFEDDNGKLQNLLASSPYHGIY